MNYERVESNETLPLPETVIYVIRHAEPQVYNANTPLNKRGRGQAKNLGIHFSEKFTAEGGQKNIESSASYRTRAFQTVFIVKKHLLQDSINGTLHGMHFEKTTLSRDLLTAPAISPLLDPYYSDVDGTVIEYQGVPPENVCAAWLNLSDDQLEDYGSESPDRMLVRFMNTLNIEEQQSKEREEKRKSSFNQPFVQINKLWVSHEPFFWAFAQALDPYIDITNLNFKHTEYLQFDIAYGTTPTILKFRGKKYTRTGEFGFTLNEN